MRRLSIVVAMIATLAISGSVLATAPTAKIGALQPNWTLGVYSAYYGPNDSYLGVSPGFTATYLGRQAGIIKAGLTIDPTDGVYEDEGLFAFKPNVTIGSFASSPLTYDVVNQYGTNPVWMTIEIDTGIVGDRSDNVTFQMVPAAYVSTAYTTVNAATGTWYKWNNDSGDTTGNPPMSLADIKTAYAGLTVVRAYLRLGMGDSYGPGPNGTQAWVDKASIGGVTYDFVVKGTTYALKDWGSNPGNHGFKTP